MLFNPNVFYETLYEPSLLAVQSPQQVHAPDAVLSISQSVVSMCEAVSVSIGSYQYNGGRALAIQWSLIQPTVAAQSAFASFLQAQTNQSTVTIQPSQLQKLTQFQIQAQITNFLGQQAARTLTFTPTGCLQSSATFGSDLQSLIVRFTGGDYTLQNSTLDNSGDYLQPLCAYLFSSQTLALLGSLPLCQ